LGGKNHSTPLKLHHSDKNFFLHLAISEMLGDPVWLFAILQSSRGILSRTRQFSKSKLETGQYPGVEP